MKILFVAVEATPYAKVGGLADVVGSLPKALIQLGHDVRIMMPKYGSIDLDRYSQPGKTIVKRHISSKTGVSRLYAAGLKNNIPLYLIEQPDYFGGNEIYGNNDIERYYYFSKAAAELIPQLKWQPDIIHCHDWHTALIVMWLKTMGYSYGTVFTIHNLAYQGEFEKASVIGRDLEKTATKISNSAPQPPRNFLSRGILWADLITTVSETYAKEILTIDHGNGLESLLQYRKRSLIGIVNGIDYTEFNPGKDVHLQANYSTSTLKNRLKNKAAIQKRGHLAQQPDIPLIGMVQRLEEQKGFDIFKKAVDGILKNEKAQIAILGQGARRYERMLSRFAAKYPGQLATFTDFDNPLAHLIYGGCDLFLMPSRFEPCGLGQLIAMRYGALPVVRHTGGLIETVPVLTSDLSEGRGFVFCDYDSKALLFAVQDALHAYNNKKKAWGKAMQRIMNIDFSWRTSAMKYEMAYKKVLQKTRRKMTENS
ncbi:MAG TPA: hypothetical protein DCX22_03930 [Dehalococcoidia bacterium]|nr:hypothetical protein [Dehalococcoidia bacterium]